MGTALTAPVRGNAERRSQTVKVDFYKVRDEGIGRIEFRNALRAAMRLHGVNRSRDVWGERVDLYVCHESGSIIEGEIGRVRMNDTPAIANRDCSVNEISLDDGQGIAERTAFLYDSQRAVLALHAKREAVSASRIAGFCNHFSGNEIESFSLNPILRTDAEQKFRSMDVIKKVEVEYFRGAGDIIANSDISTSSFVRSLETLQGETLTVAVSSGRKKRNRLSLGHVRELIQTALTGRDEVVRKLTISGRNASDEALFIDLLEDRLRTPVLIEVRGRTASYEQRRRAVRRAYESNLSLLQ